MHSMKTTEIKKDDVSLLTLVLFDNLAKREVDKEISYKEIENFEDNFSM